MLKRTVSIMMTVLLMVFAAALPVSASNDTSITDIDLNNNGEIAVSGAESFSDGPVITGQPVNWVGPKDKNAKFTVTAEGDGLNYQWYYRSPGKTSWNATSGTKATYTIQLTEARNNRELYCKITDANNKSVDSDIVTMTIEQPLAPVITTQPVSWVGEEGKNAKFTVVAQGSGLTYQWYYRSPGKTNWTATSGTKATYTIQLTEARNNREFYCKITDANNMSVDSDIVTMTIEQPLAPVITAQPVSWVGEEGKNAKFTVVAQGSGLTYQWYYRSPGKTSWNATSGTKATYTIQLTEARNNREFYCKITDANNKSVDSDIVTMTIEQPSVPVITAQPVNWVGAEGKNAKFTVEAIGDSLTYQWYYRDAGKTAWSKSSNTKATCTVQLTAARNRRQFYCKITDSQGNSIDSDIVSMTIVNNHEYELPIVP